MMSVVWYSQSPRVGSGIARVGFEVAKRLSSRHGIDLHYYAPSEPATRPMPYHGYRLYGSGDNSQQSQLQWLLKRVQPDVLVTNLNWFRARGTSQPINNLSRESGIEVPTLMYGPTVETEEPFTALEKSVLANYITPVHMIRYVEPRFERMQSPEWSLSPYLLPDGWVPHGVDHSAFNPDHDTESVREELGIGDRTAVLSVGSNWRRKNLDLLLAAFKQYRGTVDGDPVLLLHTERSGSRGGLYENWMLPTVVEELGLTATQDSAHNAYEDVQVIFTKNGEAADDKLASLYATADMMCLPSDGEGFSLTTLEAMACGTPVVQTDLPTLRWLSGDAAAYIDVAQHRWRRFGERAAVPSTESIATELARLHNDPAERERLAELGMERASDFSWDRTADEIASLLREHYDV